MDYTVGELAKRAGLTVRTLHHYEELGLLRPSGRSEAGYRRYGEADVLRLHRVLALRDAGLSLKAIAPLLDGEAPQPLAAVLQGQIEQIEAQLLAQETLLQTLRNAAKRLALHGDGGDALQVLLDAMAIRRVQERWFSAEQMRSLRRHWEAIPAAERDAVEQAWPALIRAARDAMEAGRDPAAPEVQALVRRWLSLQKQFMSASADMPRMEATMKRMYAAEPELVRQSGVTPELLAYLRLSKASLPPEEQA
ncbi:MerR family transcriptional regulator [Pelomonas aquatica]|jgi:DNA-binding transcriptional MerR regulator|uniref:MerR family transcriptional regulator n=1 Tax=Pelomonas aquatica TaxID=431058 RepID=A0A9X4LM21_9BURK|nr:MerR family transcriptional regulator [Pelomonas aquatica]MCY4755748.1 MerR family transcriptional regulator [Pelomonas aquatica]MDG0862733.1 MerR family transcriptional regulator [Pelomonas aquatica]